MELKAVLDRYMQKVEGLDAFCARCLRTERWGGSVLLMLVDAAFDSIGLNYFTAVVPKVWAFKREFVDTGIIPNLKTFAHANPEQFKHIWKNARSWRMAMEVASCLSSLASNDREAMRTWARASGLENWENDPVGRVHGVGLVTYQYLRMMGGIDTVMPDKIVKRVINQILVEAGEKPVEDNLEFIRKCEDIAHACGYRPIEVCWMTWLVQEEGRRMRMEKYRDILPLI
jgi:hypothetical protein